MTEALTACRWRWLTATGVAGQGIRALELWRRQRDWLDIELSWLLDESA